LREWEVVQNFWPSHGTGRTNMVPGQILQGHIIRIKGKNNRLDLTMPDLSPTSFITVIGLRTYTFRLISGKDKVGPK
jgi:hypothetical protein